MRRLVTVVLENGIDIAVVECPLILGAWYANTLNPALTPMLLGLAHKFEEAFPSINIFLDRGDLEFDHIGRFTDHNEQAIVEMDRSLYSFVSDHVGTANLHVITSPFNWELDKVLAKVLVSNAGVR